jgi:AcrR family transcriptional regulator
MNAITLNKKHNNILAAAKMLFWKYGFKRVSIEEICREAKVSKVTFYKFYPNKIELAKTIIDQIVDNSMKDLKHLVENAVSTHELLGTLIKAKKEGVHEISREFVSDFYTDNSLGLKEYLLLRINEVTNETIVGLKHLQERGLIRSDLNIPFFLYFAKKMDGFMDDPYLLSLFPNPEDLVMEITNLLTYGMTPRTNQP